MLFRPAPVAGQPVRWCWGPRRGYVVPRGACGWTAGGLCGDRVEVMLFRSVPEAGQPAGCAGTEERVMLCHPVPEVG